MLPSMPLLMTPMRELADDSSCSSDDSPTNNRIENGATEQHINSSCPPSAIATCSLESGENRAATPSNSNKVNKVSDKLHSPEKRPSSEPTSAQKKKKKNQHKKTLAALTPDSGPSLNASAQNFAEVYFQKVRSQLDDEKWNLFVQELVSFEEQTEKRPVELYHRMKQLLAPHSELVDEFLGFLLPQQALEADQFMAFLTLGKMNEFFRKLNILVMKRHVRQVYSALEDFACKSNVTLTDVKQSILPLLKSSPMLVNLFLELLPGERPPDSLMTDFEQVDMKQDPEFETIIVPDCPDPYGNEKCICHCHSAQSRHCNVCGIKYLNGRVYIQYGKVLRPAKVIFQDKKHQDLQKWEEEKRRTKRKFMPKTISSPSSFDHRVNADSEDDCGVKKSPRTPRVRGARAKVCKKGLNEVKEEGGLEGIFPLVESKNKEFAANNVKELVDSEMKHDNIEEHDFDEIVLENECNTEEDEEEYLNKGLHSENESSLEAEDIAKELECSFEDEEVEDIENTEMEQSENPTICKENEPVKPSSEGLENVQAENVIKLEVVEVGCTLLEKTQNTDANIQQEKNQNTDASIDEDKNLNTDVSFKSSSYLDSKNEPKCEHEVVLKNEILAQSDNHETELAHIIKTEEEEIMDVSESGLCSEFQNVPSASVTGDIDSSCREWTREEDKIILQTFQYENGLEQTFETASFQLPNRSKEEIQERFEILMKLLKEMISDKSNSDQ